MPETPSINTATFHRMKASEASLGPPRCVAGLVVRLRSWGCFGRRSNAGLADFGSDRRICDSTYHRWRNQFGGLKAEDAKRLKDLERENATLKRLLADAELEKAALKEIAKGNF